METALRNQLAARVPPVEGGELEKQLGKGCVEDCRCLQPLLMLLVG